MRRDSQFIFAALLLTSVFAFGCTPETKPTGGGGSTPPTTQKKEMEHDHEHDHAHHDHAAHGPNGGHILELGEEEYHAEWLHDDSGKVTVIILDGKMEKEVPITAPELRIQTQVGDKTNTYDLAAVNPSEGEKPQASRFEIVDKPLVAILSVAGKAGTTAKMTVDINGKSYAAPFEQHDHDH